MRVQVGSNLKEDLALVQRYMNIVIGCRCSDVLHVNVDQPSSDNNYWVVSKSWLTIISSERNLG